MIVGVPKETYPGDARVALPPPAAAKLVKAGFSVLIERGAGIGVDAEDAAYERAGCEIATDRDDVFRRAGLVVSLRGPGSSPGAEADIDRMRKGQMLVSFVEPLASPETCERLARRGATVLAMEMIPRIARAQSMDALSSMATVSGYMAVLLAATRLPKFFPMFMTAAGTISPARVFVLGAGVAGLQAIATARRLGAVVEAYDTRPVVKEQVESLGARFVELEIETGESEASTGYATAQSEAFYRKQQALMVDHVRGSDVVITTALVPGRKAPVLISEDVVRGMRTGAVVVDLAAEKGGNCELTVPGETVERHDVTIVGPVNLPASLAVHASQMYGHNVVTLLTHLAKAGEIALDLDDEITRGALVTHGGEIVNEAVKKALAPAAAGGGS